MVIVLLLTAWYLRKRKPRESMYMSRERFIKKIFPDIFMLACFSYIRSFTTMPVTFLFVMHLLWLNGTVI